MKNHAVRVVGGSGWWELMKKQILGADSGVEGWP